MNPRGRQRAFFFDQRYCTACQACHMACKDYHDHPVGVSWRRVTTFQAGHYPSVRVTHLSQACYHCGQPPCVAACPQGALQKRAADGVVTLAADQCAGCQECLAACPYGAIATDPTSGRSSKCDFCVALVDTGEPPVCVSACPVHVLEAGWLDAMAGEPLQGPGLPDPDVLHPAARMRRHRHHGPVDRGGEGPEG
jgi:anaerobic dimethyl sulfoxide reductase subunit B